MQTVTQSSAAEVQAAAVLAVNNALQAAVDANQEVLLLLSGGSNLAVAGALNRNLLANATIYPLDERFSSDPELNNSLQLKKLGLPVEVLQPELQETVAAMGTRFDQLLHDWKLQHPDGVVIATLGMGADGHTAGISPLPDNPTLFSQLFENEASWAVGYEGRLVPPERVTVTFAFLHQVNHLVALVTGAAKQQILAQALTVGPKPSQLPMAALADHPTLTLFTDLPVSRPS